MEDSRASREVEVYKSETIQLRCPPEITTGSTTVPISILDATTAQFSTTSVVWFYEAATQYTRGTNPLSIAQLRLSLVKTLSYYPWFTGSLGWAHSSERPFAATSHDKRFRRLTVTCDDLNTDQGASYIEASCRSHTLAELLPPPNERNNQWDPATTGWATADFLPPITTLAFGQYPSTEGSCLGVQITTFKCGGIAIGIAIPHPIADALTVTNFMRDWSNINAAMVKGPPTPEPTPCFQPSLLDAKATGDIDMQSSDSTVISRARDLPMLRYDRWVDNKGTTNIDKLPAELQQNQHLLPPHDVVIPWESWNLAAPVSYRVLHFSPPEMEGMYRAALSGNYPPGSNDEPAESKPPTRHDALLAHLWQCINVARLPILESNYSSEVFLTMTLGLRARLSLPPSFVGSPILLTYVSRPVDSFHTLKDSKSNDHNAAPSSNIGRIAADIHNTQALFTAPAIGDALHDAAYEICPQRLWQTMCGSRHTLTTSWIHTHVYDDIDFGCGVNDTERSRVVPWYVHPAVFKPDGQVIIMEARPGNAAKSEDKWYHRGVDVCISLQEDVMERMLSGDLLRRWQS